MIGMTVAILCSYTRLRAVPVNYIALAVYTFFHAFVVAALLPQYSPTTVMGAAVSTLGMFVALTAYACFTKTDITMKGGALCTAGMMIFMFMIMNWIIRSAILHTVIIIVVIVLMSMWVVYDTQLIIGGKKRYQLELDDYTIGALIIYSDVMTIFLYILELFGGRS